VKGRFAGLVSMQLRRRSIIDNACMPVTDRV